MTAIDRLLGRVPMHRLTWWALALLAVIAFALGAANVLPYGPLTLAVHAALLLAVSHGANWLIGRIAGARPHYSSTTITALLLFFLLPPSLDVSYLVAAGVAALLAVASKYLIAWRGRHLLNPAAFGAFAVTFLGISFSSWWVATPWLLPVVAVLGLLVLLRARVVLVAVVFVVVAAGVTIGRLAAASAPDPLGLAFGSFPYVFAAAFMLSEPLTLPPRRWQRLLVAALAGLVASIPFSTGSLPLGDVTLGALHWSFALGPVSSTPEVALLAANLVAFAFGQRRGVRLEFAGARELSPTSAEFAFRPLSPVRFAAGQYLELHLPHRPADRRGTRRVFSIAAAPGGEVRFGVRFGTAPSSFKRALLALQPGDRIAATRAGGDFTLPADPAVPLLLVAGGIGATPFLAQLHDLAGTRRDLVVVYATGASGDTGFLADLLDAASRVDGARVLLAAAAPPADLRADWIGPERATATALAAAVPDLAARRALVAGSPAFVAGMRRELRRAGVRRIRTDTFLGY